MNKTQKRAIVNLFHPENILGVTPRKVLLEYNTYVPACNHYEVVGVEMDWNCAEYNEALSTINPCDIMQIETTLNNEEVGYALHLRNRDVICIYVFK